MRLSPVPKKSKNCFGDSSVDMGQNRLPMPPAMITQYGVRMLWCGSS